MNIYIYIHTSATYGQLVLVFSSNEVEIISYGSGYFHPGFLSFYYQDSNLYQRYISDPDLLKIESRILHFGIGKRCPVDWIGVTGRLRDNI